MHLNLRRPVLEELIECRVSQTACDKAGGRATAPETLAMIESARSPPTSQLLRSASRNGLFF